VRFVLETSFSAQAYGQSMGGRVLIFKPAILGRRGRTGFTEDERKYPVVLGSDAFKESVIFDLPRVLLSMSSRSASRSKPNSEPTRLRGKLRAASCSSVVRWKSATP